MDYFKKLFRNSPNSEKNHRKAQLGYPTSESRDLKQVLPAYAFTARASLVLDCQTESNSTELTDSSVT